MTVKIEQRKLPSPIRYRKNTAIAAITQKRPIQENPQVACFSTTV